MVKKKLMLFLGFLLSLGAVFAEESLLITGLKKIGSSLIGIFKSNNALIAILFIVFTALIYAIYSQVLVKLKLFKDNKENGKKISLLLSIISVLGFFYIGYKSSGGDKDLFTEFLITYLGLPGLIAIFAFGLLIVDFMRKLVKENFQSNDYPEEVKKYIKLGGISLGIGILCLMLITYVGFLGKGIYKDKWSSDSLTKKVIEKSEVKVKSNSDKKKGVSEESSEKKNEVKEDKSEEKKETDTEKNNNYKTDCSSFNVEVFTIRGNNNIYGTGSLPKNSKSYFINSIIKSSKSLSEIMNYLKEEGVCDKGVKCFKVVCNNNNNEINIEFINRETKKRYTFNYQSLNNN